ncbi:hypothetical protein QTJ16_000525 [Diplocarpon rosae]|uniref:Zn(2)-C6 fungal-type domain-containing protein n=1 Tax=Diplocarpon rosae TaxID=946125 RepID=A0AAD9T7C0_9HELO|nr:hypothetical protein QTJ16_000525 [Diplocarpon rosae]
MSPEMPGQRPSLSVAIKPPKHRKFRSSCDACSASKVRCDQGESQCLRCTNLGLRCNYSPSRRMGKPPASSRKLVTTCTYSSSVNIAAPKSNEQPRPAKRRQLSSPALTQEPLMSLPTRDQDHSGFNCSPMDNRGFNQQGDMFPIPTSSKICNAPGIDPLASSTLFDISFDFAVSSDDFQLSYNPYILSEESNNMEMSSIRTQDATSHSFQSFSFPSSSQPNQQPSPPSSTSSETPQIYSHNLDHSRVAPPCAYPTTSSFIEQVLVKSKAQLDHAHALLACSRPEDPHFALTLALTCINILRQYEGAVKAAPGLQAHRASDGSTASFLSTTDSYHIDAEEERIRIQTVAREVPKVQGLVDRYAEKYCFGSDGRRRKDVEVLYSTLEVFLRGRVMSTMRECINRLQR